MLHSFTVLEIRLPYRIETLYFLNNFYFDFQIFILYDLFRLKLAFDYIFFWEGGLN